MQRKLISVLAAALLLLTSCTGVFPQNTSEPSAEPALPVLHLWAIGGGDSDKVKSINVALNALTQEKYGFSVELTLVSRSNYSQQLNLAFLRGDGPDVFAIYQQPAFDDLYAAGRLLNLDSYVDDSFFRNLDIPEELWPRTMREGNHYGVTSNTKICQSMAYKLLRSIADEFDVDDSRLWSWEELHELLLQIKAAHPEQYPIVSHYGETLTYLGQDSLGDDLGVLIDERSGDTTVENLYASELYYEFCSRMHGWYQEGLIVPDAYAGQLNGYIQIAEGLGTGMLIRATSTSTSSWASLWLAEPTVDTYTNYVMWGISAQSNHCQEAVTLLQALFTDLDICKLLMLGEEGVDYQISEPETGADPQINLIGGDWTFNEWAWPGSQLLQNYYHYPKSELQLPEGTTLVQSPAYGFAFDSSGLEAQILRCQEVVSKYNGALLCGFLDPDTAIPLFLQELEQAGIDAIIAEKQRQLDAWLAQSSGEEAQYP